MNSQEPFKREYGFCYIVTPEDKAKYGPKRELDESWAGVQWMPSGIFNGCSFHPELSYRRKISPGPNHEIVPWDGVLSITSDQYTRDGKSWFHFNDYWDKTMVRDIFTHNSSILAFRRPISKPVESAWVSVKERLPEPYQQVVAIPPSTHDAKDGLLVSLESYNTTNYRWVKVITHWMPIPPAPQPPRPAAEVAFDSWLHSASIPTCGLKSARDGWEAALDWARTHLSELSKEGK